MSVEVHNLSKQYGPQWAVKDISFSLEKGEIVGFLGPNGAGKSTTMKMLTGYKAPSSGEAKIFGHSILGNLRDTRKHIGYLPEHNPLYLDMYVKEYLSFSAEIHSYKGIKRKRIDEVVNLTGLELEKNKKIGQISKGYRQRVGLAQALLHNPDVLILDEPTSGLDPNQIIEIRSLIKDVSGDKIIIFSTHILSEVQALCSRVLIIDKGQLISDKPVADLLNSTSSKHIVKVKFKNNIETKYLEDFIQSEVKSESLNSFSIVSEDLNHLKDQLFEVSIKLNNPIYELKENETGLEGIFQELTNPLTKN